MHFSEIIELQFEKKAPYIALHFAAFQINCCFVISNKCVLTSNFLFGFREPLLRSAFPS